MNLESQQTFKGRFWLPTHSARDIEHLDGTLTITDRGQSLLELQLPQRYWSALTFDDQHREQFLGVHYERAHRTDPLICGRLDNGKSVALEDCRYGSRTIFGLAAWLEPKRTIVTTEEIAAEAPTFTQFRVNIEALSTWLDHRGVRVRPWQWAGEPEVGVTKSEARTRESEVNSQGRGFSLSCSFEWTGNSIGQHQVMIGQEPVLKVEPVDHVAVAAADLIRVTETFQRFLWLATNRPVQLLSIHGPTGTEVFTGEWVPSVVGQAAEVSWPEMIFTHGDVGSRLPAMLREWYEYYEQNEWVIDLLFNACYGRNLLRQSLVDCAQFLDRMAPNDENDPRAEALFDEVARSCRGDPRTWIKNQRDRLCKKRRVEAIAALIHEHGQLLGDALSFAGALWTNRGRLVHGGPPGLCDDELQEHVRRAVAVARWIVLHAIGFSIEELTLMAKSRPRIWNSLEICGESDDITAAANELIELRETLEQGPSLEG